MDPVKSTHNTFIKYILKLKKRRFREQEGRFLIEGIRFVEEALTWGWPLDNIIYSADLLESERGSRLVEGASAKNIKMVPVERKLFDELAFTESPQGLMALCKMKRWELDEVSGVRQWGRVKQDALFVVVDRVGDPGNLGTIIRSADAFGADGVILMKGTVDLYNSKTLRATMGSIFHLPVLSNVHPSELLEQLTGGDMSLLVGVPEGGQSVNNLDLKRPLALVVGSEADGPSRELVSLPHTKVSIPMLGRAESLNAGVAASIILYEIVRQGNGQ